MNDISRDSTRYDTAKILQLVLKKKMNLRLASAVDRWAKGEEASTAEK